ncbi:WbqC family protein [Vibrio cyclitrophicus]|nr:hypothetical protein F0Z19_4834 [Vibrio cyclitrophicus]
MKLAVMQPYLFPYIGYYQLVNSVDKFVFYDDVNFIKCGYINRNNILVNGKSQMFTLPVLSASQNKLINELSFSENVKKILKTIEQTYSKAPYFNDVFPIIKGVLSDANRSVVNLTIQSVVEVFKYLGIEKEFFLSSEIGNDKSLIAKERLIDMTKILDCDIYINSPGGKSLYDKEYFRKSGVELNFIEMKEVSYEQYGSEFVSHLSIIDVLMWNSKMDVKVFLDEYRLV